MLAEDLRPGQSMDRRLLVTRCLGVYETVARRVNKYVYPK